MIMKFKVLMNYINLQKCPTKKLNGNKTIINIGDY